MLIYLDLEKIHLSLQTKYKEYVVMAYSLSFSKSILVLVFISDKIRRGETEFISAKVMSELLNIPKPTLSVIFNNFIRAGILESKEGINGGVRFAKNYDQVDLLDILLAIENQKSLFQTNFDLNVAGDRPDSIKKKVVDTLNNVEQVMKNELRKTSLKEIISVK
jgi:Rrf2 family protein